MPPPTQFTSLRRCDIFGTISLYRIFKEYSSVKKVIKKSKTDYNRVKEDTHTQLNTRLQTQTIKATLDRFDSLLRHSARKRGILSFPAHSAYIVTKEQFPWNTLVSWDSHRHPIRTTIVPTQSPPMPSPSPLYCLHPRLSVFLLL